MLACEICKIFKDAFFYRTAVVAASDVSLVFSKESGAKTGAIISDKYQIQLKKSILCRKNQYLSEGDNS